MLDRFPKYFDQGVERRGEKGKGVFENMIPLFFTFPRQ